jgi:hypothetical protein
VIITASAAEARLNGSTRADFLTKNYNSCIKVGTSSPVGRDILPSVLNRLCTCAGNFAADRLTMGDAATLTYGNRSERMQILQKARAFSMQGLDYCKAKARRGAQDSTPLPPKRNAGPGI